MGRETTSITITNLGLIRENDRIGKGIDKLLCKRGGSTSKGASRAQDNLIFLQQWFVNFPEYKNRDFFITGESHTGHYVPQLGKLIVESGLNFSLKGIAIGNPLLEYNTDLNSEGDYYWSHTFISDAAYELISSVCNTSQLWRERMRGSLSAACRAERCARSSSCPACWNQQLELLQPVINNSHPLDLNFALNHEIVRSESSDIQYVYCGVVNYDGQNLEIPTIDVVGSLVSLGIRVLVYRNCAAEIKIQFHFRDKDFGLNCNLQTLFEDKQVGGWTQISETDPHGTLFITRDH
ncbi:hypothetical protein GH714_035376 [Hevea brasiliensis]|uniref:Carboxypeptidase n=1 Tax=Hevea brasiliensis TaxID=3981 RepID=A0A6A6M482_HEVBR|nr:hypothetical protein GH714_035376 [Hevea brasiliensis]